jgi:hypothetical protein
MHEADGPARFYRDSSNREQEAWWHLAQGGMLPVMPRRSQAMIRVGGVYGKRNPWCAPPFSVKENWLFGICCCWLPATRNKAQCHVSCYEGQSKGQQRTRCYFSSETSEELPLPGYKRDVKCLSYLITREESMQLLSYEIAFCMSSPLLCPS